MSENIEKYFDNNFPRVLRSPTGPGPGPGPGLMWSSWENISESSLA